MKLTANFSLEEFVPRDIYSVYGDRAIIFLDKRLILLMQRIRDHVGKTITINNWKDGGQFNNRCFRMPDTTVGGKLSQHKFGRASDFNVEGMGDDETDQMIIDNFAIFKDYGLTTIENPLFTKGWSHIDIRWTGMDTLLQVNP